MDTHTRAAVRLSNPATPRGRARATRRNWGTVNRHIHQFTHRGDRGERGAPTAALQPGLPNACASRVHPRARSGRHTAAAHLQTLPLSWANAAPLPCLTRSPPSCGGSQPDGGESTAQGKGHGGPTGCRFGGATGRVTGEKLVRKAGTVGLQRRAPWDTTRLCFHHRKGPRAVTAAPRHRGFTDPQNRGHSLLETTQISLDQVGLEVLKSKRAAQEMAGGLPCAGESSVPCRDPQGTLGCLGGSPERLSLRCCLQPGRPARGAGE